MAAAKTTAERLPTGEAAKVAGDLALATSKTQGCKSLFVLLYSSAAALLPLPARASCGANRLLGHGEGGENRVCRAPPRL